MVRGRCKGTNREGQVLGVQYPTLLKLCRDRFVTGFGPANLNLIPRLFLRVWENPSQSEWMTVSFETPDWFSIQASIPKRDRFPWPWVSWQPDPPSDVETS